MLAFLYPILTFIYNEHQVISANSYVRFSGYLQQLICYCLQWKYSKHTMSYILDILMIDIYNSDKKILRVFMFAFWCLYFSWVIYDKREKHPTFNVNFYLTLGNLCIQGQQIMIFNKYVKILIPIHHFIQHGIFGSYTWHSMSDFLKPIIILYTLITNKKIPTTMLSFLRT